MTVTWPPEFELIAEDQQRALSAVTSRLAIEAPVAAWKLKGRERSVTLTQSDPPPGMVEWEGGSLRLSRRRPIEQASGHRAGRSAPVPGPCEGDVLRGPAPHHRGRQRRREVGLCPVPHAAGTAPGFPRLQPGPQVDLSPVAAGPAERHQRAREEHLHLALAWLGEELHRRTEAAYRSAAGTGNGSAAPSAPGSSRCARN